jgi:hypothetical protein
VKLFGEGAGRLLSSVHVRPRKTPIPCKSSANSLLFPSRLPKQQLLAKFYAVGNGLTLVCQAGRRPRLVFFRQIAVEWTSSAATSAGSVAGTEATSSSSSWSSEIPNAYIPGNAQCLSFTIREEECSPHVACPPAPDFVRCRPIGVEVVSMALPADAISSIAPERSGRQKRL